MLHAHTSSYGVVVYMKWGIQNPSIWWVDVNAWLLMIRRNAYVCPEDSKHPYRGLGSKYTSGDNVSAFELLRLGFARLPLRPQSFEVAA